MNPPKLIINNEECRHHPQFERGVVSESGRFYRTVPIHNFEKRILKKNPNIQYFQEYKLQLNYAKRYYVIGLKVNGKVKMVSVPKLVSECWGFYPESIYHFKLIFRDGDNSNNHYTNILYERKSKYRILTDEDKHSIKKLIEAGYSLRHIAQMFNTNETEVNRIKTGAAFGKRIIPIRQPPFKVEDAKIRRLLTYFDYSKSNTKNKTFQVLRNPNDSTDNTITGNINNYFFLRKHKYITKALEQVERINDYFSL